MVIPPLLMVAKRLRRATQVLEHLEHRVQQPLQPPVRTQVMGSLEQALHP